eukprot:CAMPEP_0113610554 /NCGR_PEP_ID=MMETSP0017_2-20120614/5089_1 /TAXON_ID=2856 /ORGANISM="Cylindrotheca closterium" /LENGTH=603 /DNA_ID=CAMNT_0000519451 /DNA_START=36 /DNA_END=1847 /DNA_ORIENTATION=+ /assembly_acc=CAM_ASM_000147
MKVFRNDASDTMTSTAKKVMSSFRNKQTQWEEAMPFGKKKTSKKSHAQNPVSSIRPNMRGGSNPNIHVPESVAKAAQIMPKLDHAELDDLPMATAKPSEIRAAAKAKRIANMAETQKAKERQQKAAEQMMKMNRYRDEIATIKKKQETEFKSKTKSNEHRGKNEIADHAVQKVLTKDVTEEDEHAVLGYKEDFQSDDGSDDEDGKIHALSPKFVSKDGQRRRASILHEMKGNFNQNLDLPNDDAPEASANGKESSTPVSITSVSLSIEPPRQRQYEADKQGRLRQARRRRSSAAGGPVNKKKAPPTRQPSTDLVPEMRRRPNTRDLLFDDPEVAPEITITTPKGKGKKYLSTQMVKEKLIDEKKQKEKEEIQEQKRKLEEAEEAFKKGHNLCWQIHDSAAALGEYRTALFIRESLLGKYHEQTGRTYFWIGKSLVKLNEFSEALVAFSRSLRIFERVVRRQHKYYKWTVDAIDQCIEKMDDPDFRTEGYKARLYASIQCERDGDAFRKKGKMAEAIAKYRDAIDNVEDYHPDAADLYSKIALILRQDGDFERAQEEYRFACEIYEMSLGADHPETVKALNEIMEKKRLGQMANMLKNKLKLKA